MSKPTLIALDWGTSNLRASLLDQNGEVLSHRSTPGGVMKVPAGQFSARLLDACGDWFREFAVPAIASGMVGSRQGWKEAPYLPCPATLTDVAQSLIQVELEDAPGRTRCVHIAPGLSCLDDQQQADVMRGEETQLFGAALSDADSCVLPGTHSKWVWMGEQGGIRSFRTYMTGELFGVLSQHSILGRLMQWHEPPQEMDLAAFTAGVNLAKSAAGHLSHTLFATRTSGLMGHWSPHQLPDFLSGILLGSEVVSALAGPHHSGQVALLGDEALCDRYAIALELNGVASRKIHQDATTQGQFLLAQAAGLISNHT